MKVLVAYGSRTGFTKGIAEFIGARLKERGIGAEVLEVKSVRDLSIYDAFVVGSALYMFHWMKEAKDFVMRNKTLMTKHPVWLFSSGPVGTSRTDSKGRNLLEVSGPKEIDELMEAVKALGHKVFFGGLDGSKLKGANAFWYKLAMKSEAARKTMSEGDFRDWREIGVWADAIAGALGARGSLSRSPGQP